MANLPPSVGGPEAALGLRLNSVGTMKLRRPALACVLAFGTALASCAASLAADPRQAPVTARDFFLYSCVHEYMQANAIRSFDGSVAYAVEHSRLSAEELDRLYDQARAFAQSIRAPDYADEEHGRPAVLAACAREAGKLE